jgi:hypothetical protein
MPSMQCTLIWKLVAQSSFLVCGHGAVHRNEFHCSQYHKELTANWIQFSQWALLLCMYNFVCGPANSHILVQ